MVEYSVPLADFEFAGNIKIGAGGVLKNMLIKVGI
jgi:hypothetical protein